MLAKDASLRAEFTKLLANPTFAASPTARLHFFVQRHPSYDRSFQRYPILRLDSPPPAGKQPVAAGSERYGLWQSGQ